jgi:hypothetical protein
MFIANIFEISEYILLNVLIFSISFYGINYIVACRKASFFLNHAIHNLVIVYYTYSDVLRVLLYPLSSMTDDYSLIPTYIHIGFHIAHILCENKSLTFIDWIHHLGSSCLIGYFNLLYSTGPALNYAIFFLTGLPGGIDYFLLFLVKTGHIRVYTEKWINRYLNLYCRMPGILIWTGITLTCYQSYNVKLIEECDIVTGYCDLVQEISLYVILLHVIFVTGNALYFADRVIISYSRHTKKCR